MASELQEINEDTQYCEKNVNLIYYIYFLQIIIIKVNTQLVMENKRLFAWIRWSETGQWYRTILPILC